MEKPPAASHSCRRLPNLKKRSARVPETPALGKLTPGKMSLRAGCPTTAWDRAFGKTGRYGKTIEPRGRCHTLFGFMRKTGLRSIFKGIGVLLAGTLIVLWFSAWWLPLALPPVLRGFAVDVAAVERLAGGRLRLEGLEAKVGDGLTLRLTRLEIPNPVQYLQGRFGRAGWRASEAVRLGDLTVTLPAPTKKSASEAPSVDPVAGFATVNDALDRIFPWVPPISAKSVRVERAEGRALVRAARLRIFETRAMADISPVAMEERLKLESSRQGGGWTLRFRSLSRPLQLRGRVSLEGDAKRITVHQAEVKAPWIDASLKNPLVLASGSKEWTETAQFRFEADLGEQSFVPAAGTVTGDARFVPPARVDFAVSGSSLEVKTIPLESVRLRGRVDAESLRLEQLAARFPEEAPGQLGLSGVYGFKNQDLNLSFEGAVSPALADRFGASGQLLETVEASGRISGAADAPEIEGRIRAPSIKFPALRALALDGTFQWTAPATLNGSVRLTQGAEELEGRIRGTLVAEKGVEARLETLRWKRDGALVLGTDTPAALAFPVQGGLPASIAGLRMDPLELSGPGGRISLEHGTAGGGLLEAERLDLSRFDPWLERSLPPLRVERWRLGLEGLAPRVQAHASGRIVYADPAWGEVELRLESARLGERAAIGPLRIAVGGSELVRAKGRLPLEFHWPEGATGPEVSLDAAGPLRGDVALTDPESAAALIEKTTGVALESPRLDLQLAGTLARPQGHLRLDVPSIDPEGVRCGPRPPAPWPEIVGLALDIEADAEAVTLRRFEARTRGASLDGSGRWPLPESPGSLLSNPSVAAVAGWLGSGDYRCSLDAFALENWTPYLPDFIRRSGHATASIRHDRQGGLEGTLSLKDLALRPTRHFSAVDSIDVVLSLAGPKLIAERASARVGGSPVRLSGKVDWSDLARHKWHLAISGENVPLIRRPEMILRSDLDVQLGTLGGSTQVQVGGRLDLRSSTLLVEFDPLAPPVRSGPASRPPFFAVGTAPFDQWELDLRIEGERFLRVRSPYFQSVVSGGFTLAGTLGQPLLTGSARLADGHLSFPGAKVTLESGEAFIEAARPDALQLDISGTAKTGTHIVTMDIGGSAAQPQIQFDSTPPLPNATIARLLTTGSTTGGGVGSVGLYLGRGLLGAGGMNEGLGGRLTIDIGEETTRSGRNTFGARYDLQEDLSLEGKYDIYDSYNMNLLWTVFKR